MERQDVFDGFFAGFAQERGRVVRDSEDPSSVVLEHQTGRKLVIADRAERANTQESFHLVQAASPNPADRIIRAKVQHIGLSQRTPVLAPQPAIATEKVPSRW